MVIRCPEDTVQFPTVPGKSPEFRSKCCEVQEREETSEKGRIDLLGFKEELMFKASFRIE